MLNTEYWFKTLRDVDGLDREKFADTEYIAERIFAHTDGRGWYTSTRHCLAIVEGLQSYIKPVIAPFFPDSNVTVFGFLDVFSGLIITDPYVSTCSRFDVEPTDAYGLDASDLEWLAMLNGVYELPVVISPAEILRERIYAIEKAWGDAGTWPDTADEKLAIEAAILSAVEAAKEY
jgi:hypothetical protein